MRAPLFPRRSFSVASFQNLYLLNGKELPLSYAGAFIRDLIPGSLALEVAAPERKGPALRRARGIDRAALVEENTISTRPLDERIASSHLAKIALAEAVYRKAEVLRKRLDLRWLNPHITGSPRTAIPAACAGKAQTLAIPRF
jgi:hypothetical protein